MGRPLGRKTITIVRGTKETNAYGDDVLSWGSATRTVVRGCDVQPGTTSEYLMNRNEATVAWTVFAPPGTDVTEFDRVEFNGRTYEVDGHPAQWDSYSARQDYVEIILKDWSG